MADFDRPLNKRGKNDAPVMGKCLVEKEIRPDLVLSSPAKRAMATMKRIAKEIGISERKIARDSRIYEASAPDLLELVRGLDDCHREVILCGHNPGLTDFSNMVSDCGIVNIPTCGVVSIKFMVDSWKDVAPGLGETEYFKHPKEMASQS